MSKILIYLFFSLFILSGITLSAQTKYEATEISFIVAGTSTLHDWEIEGISGKCSAFLDIDASGKLTSIKNVNFSFGSKSLKSGKSAMDSNVYKALKSSKYPNISGEMVNMKLSTSDNVNFKITGNMNVQIGGITKQVDIVATGKLSGNTLSIKGENKLDMTKFNIDPPSFMFGTVNTGKDVVVKYNLILAK